MKSIYFFAFNMFKKVVRKYFHLWEYCSRVQNWAELIIALRDIHMISLILTLACYFFNILPFFKIIVSVLCLIEEWSYFFFIVLFFYYYFN